MRAECALFALIVIGLIVNCPRVNCHGDDEQVEIEKHEQLTTQTVDPIRIVDLDGEHQSVEEGGPELDEQGLRAIRRSTTLFPTTISAQVKSQ